MNLSTPELLRNRAYINGQWIPASDGKTFDVLNPYDRSTIGAVPDMGTSETEAAVEAAQAAFLEWRTYSAGERAVLLERWHDLHMEHQEDLAILLTTEQGKPLAEARGEIAYGAAYIKWFAEEARRIYGDVIPGHTRNARLLALKQPVGVVATITPWNFPNAMLARKVGPALAAGCTVVAKPAEDTPLSALAMAYLAQKAGIPPGVFNVVTTNVPASVGGVLTRHPLVRKISFTGSTEVGKLLMKQGASTVKKISLELGGNAPFIVFDDADLDAAVAGAMAAKYRNAGQTCICANRIYAQASIYEAFIERFAEAVRDLNIGSGLEDGTLVGPLINEAAINKVESLVSAAVDNGASVRIGGGRAADQAGGYFYQPTVLSGVNPSMTISKEEIFGPVAPVYPFDTEEEVIALANDTQYGLAAYFFGRDINRIWRVAEGLEYGMVGINTGKISTPVAPFGGGQRKRHRPRRVPVRDRGVRRGEVPEFRWGGVAQQIKMAL